MINNFVYTNIMNISNIKNCYGCGVCATACPRKIISLALNSDGFYEPYLNDKESCLLEYNSQTGDLCLLVGNDRKIITLLTTYTSGKRIISSITTNKMMLPGSFDGYT